MDQKIKFPELFNPKFMSACSAYSSIQEFFDSSGLELSDAELLSDNGTQEMDNYVNSETTYSTWKEMRGTAWQTYVDERVTQVIN